MENVFYESALPSASNLYRKQSLGTSFKCMHLKSAEVPPIITPPSVTERKKILDVSHRRPIKLSKVAQFHTIATIPISPN